MGTLHLQRLSFGFLTVLLAVGFADATAALVGAAECSDCSATTIKAEHAFRGLLVAIKCKAIAGERYETMAVDKLDKDGNFRVGLPAHVLGDDGELNRECFAVLHGGAANEPCQATLSKIALQSKENGMHTFGVEAGKLPFSSVCSSATFLHKYLPPHKPLPKFSLPPKPHFFPPVYKKPLPPPAYKPPPAVPYYEHAHPHPKFELPPLYKKPFPKHDHYHPGLPPYSPHPTPKYSGPKKPYTPSGEVEAAAAEP